MKTRPPRMNVALPARIRWQGAWLPATVRNISERGLMLRTTTPPQPGTYVEVQLGTMAITAKAVWAERDRCGLRTQDRVNLQALRATPNGGGRGQAGLAPSPRSTSNASAKFVAEHSQRISSAIQYATFLALSVAVAGTLGWEVFKTLSAPFNIIEAQLK